MAEDQKLQLRRTRYLAPDFGFGDGGGSLSTREDTDWYHTAMMVVEEQVLGPGS